MFYKLYFHTKIQFYGTKLNNKKFFSKLTIIKDKNKANNHVNGHSFFVCKRTLDF